MVRAAINWATAAVWTAASIMCGLFWGAFLLLVWIEVAR